MKETAKWIGILAFGVFLIIIAIIQFSMPVSTTKWYFGSKGFDIREKTSWEMLESYASPIWTLIIGILCIAGSILYFYFNRKRSNYVDAADYEVVDNDEVVDDYEIVDDDEVEDDDIENDEYIQQLYEKQSRRWNNSRI